MKLYIVLNTSNYVDFNYDDDGTGRVGIREDIGNYIVKEVSVDGWKDIAKKFCGYDPEVIENCVFNNEHEAYRIALSRTCEKLNAVDKKVNKCGRK